MASKVVLFFERPHGRMKMSDKHKEIKFNSNRYEAIYCKFRLGNFRTGDQIKIPVAKAHKLVPLDRIMDFITGVELKALKYTETSFWHEPPKAR